MSRTSIAKRTNLEIAPAAIRVVAAVGRAVVVEGVREAVAAEDAVMAVVAAAEAAVADTAIIVEEDGKIFRRGLTRINADCLRAATRVAALFFCRAEPRYSR